MDSSFKRSGVVDRRCFSLTGKTNARNSSASSGRRRSMFLDQTDSKTNQILNGYDGMKLTGEKPCFDVCLFKEEAASRLVS
jgi:hypothetical protein